MEDLEHILEDVHLGEIGVLGVEDLLIGEVQAALFDVDLVGEGFFGEVDCVFNDHALNITVDLADFGEGLAGGFVDLVVDVEAGVGIGLENPRGQGLIK